MPRKFKHPVFIFRLRNHANTGVLLYIRPALILYSPSPHTTGKTGGKEKASSRKQPKGEEEGVERKGSEMIIQGKGERGRGGSRQLTSSFWEEGDIIT